MKWVNTNVAGFYDRIPFLKSIQFGIEDDFQLRLNSDSPVHVTEDIPVVYEETD